MDRLRLEGELIGPRLRDEQRRQAAARRLANHAAEPRQRAIEAVASRIAAWVNAARGRTSTGRTPCRAAGAVAPAGNAER